MSRPRQFGRLVIVVGVAAVVAVVAYALFVWLPGSLAELLGVLAVLALVAASLKIGSRLAGALLGAYNVAEVEVDSVITRDGGPSVPLGAVGTSADDVVEQIERADADRNAEGLIVKLNTPGGQVVPSEDIRRAAAEFDGPTVAYAEDMAASGGFWIASGCDEVHAREGSIVGSIGVTFSHLGRKELADKVGLDYRRFVAGDYKDTISSQWRELRDDEVDYVQGLIDDYYDQFVDRVVDGRDLEDDAVRDTEARVYLGRDAHDLDLVDTCGPRAEMEDRLAERMGVDEVVVEPFEPEAGLSEKLTAGARGIARAFGAGVAGVLVGEDDAPPVRAR